MLTRMDPIPAKGHTLLIFSEPSTTTTQIYPPLRHGDPDPSSEALYVVSETDRARRVNVRRGPREAEAPVAELRYSGRKGVSVQWKDADVSGTVKFTEWMTRANKRGGTHQVTIAGEEYEWSELRDGGAVVCYPLFKGRDIVARYVPQSIAQPTSGSAERVLTRAHIEFLSTQLPDERVTDGIVVSCLAIQHINLLLANTNNVFPFCCLGPGPTC